ncbi:MAG: hypothetical protein P1Q69_14705, partial [Candidatus Thorarchaeota archaeon]|nr:hypothetical protein [Candidatus Thorarchaeota archaeon]
MSLPNDVAADMDFQEDDTFRVQFDTALTGHSGDYDEYTEHEMDVRVYNVDSVSGDSVEMSMGRSYTYEDSDGGYYEETSGNYFSINSTDGSYLDGTLDAPSDYVEYFTFDNIWFRIDPTLPEGSTVRILGNDYTVNGLTSIFLDYFTAVDAIEVQVLDVIQLVNDPEYDPNGPMTLTIDDTFYFDPATGYFIMEVWDVDVSTSVGRFSWYEIGILQTSSYSLQVNTAATVGRLGLYGLGVIAFLGFLVVVDKVAKYQYRAEVDKAIRIMSGQLLPPKATAQKSAPILWKPLEIDYHSLIEGTPKHDLMTLQPGVFLVIDPRNKLAIVDTKTSPKFKNLVTDFELSSLELLYKLVLGTIAKDTVEYEEA